MRWCPINVTVVVFSVVCVCCFGCAVPKQRREQFVIQHPGLPLHMKDAVLRGSVHEGMTMDAVRASWGKPDKRYQKKFGSVPAVHWEYRITHPDRVDTYVLIFRYKQLVKMDLKHSTPK